MRRTSFIVAVLVLLLLPSGLLAQTSAAGPSKVAVVDFNRVVTESAEGRKAVTQFNSKVSELQTAFEALQKQIAEDEEKLRTGQNVMSDAAKAELTRKIDANNTKLTRDNEDAQKQVAEQQNILFGPVAQLAKSVMDAYAKEAGYAVVFDSSSQASSIIYADPVADITTEVIRRVDAEASKAAPKP
jgi:Skp family chaperone for outer membrane proteins